MSDFSFSVLQDEAESVLSADPWFDPIPLFTERLQDIESKIDVAVGRVTGICGVICTPLMNVNYPNKPLYFDQVKMVVRFFEKPILNETGKRCMDAAVMACLLLHRHHPASEVTEVILCDKPTIKLGNDPKWLSYDACFFTQGGVDYQVPQVADPVIAAAGGGLFSVTCATPGAAIFYTATPGTIPSPRSGTLYTAPFAASAPVTIKARAWLAGYTTSKTVSQTF